MSRNHTKIQEKGGKRRKKYDSEYIAYCKNGDSAAVFIMRDIQDTVSTDDKWIDVLSKKIRWSESGWHDFEYFEVELFPKKIRPVYSKFMTDSEKKYETWKTAQSDIQQQRNNGYKGIKYRVYPCIDVSYIYVERTRATDITLEVFDPKKNAWIDYGHGPVPRGAEYRSNKRFEKDIVRKEIRKYKVRMVERIE